MKDISKSLIGPALIFSPSVVKLPYKWNEGGKQIQMENEQNNGNNQQTRVASITVSRLFNLGDYENIRYDVRADIGQGDDPGRVLTNLETILNDLHAKGCSLYSLREAEARVKEFEVKPENELQDYEKDWLADAREIIKKHEDARVRQKRARASLATLNYTSEHKDHKQSWDDDDDYEF